MTRQIIDISMPIENEVISDPLPYNPKITYFNHHQSYEQMAPFFGGLEEGRLPDGEAWAVEMVQLITHNGTHLDAPYHFASTMNKGERAITIDEVPLDWCMQPGVKLDFRHFDDGYVVTARDVAGARANRPRAPAARHRRRQYAGRFRLRRRRLRGRRLRDGLRRHDVPAGTRRAPDRHRRDGAGTRPFPTPRSATPRAAMPRSSGRGTRRGRDIGYCHLEKLHNLEALPGDGFTVCCFPVKIRGASALDLRRRNPGRLIHDALARTGRPCPAGPSPRPLPTRIPSPRSGPNRKEGVGEEARRGVSSRRRRLRRRRRRGCPEALTMCSGPGKRPSFTSATNSRKAETRSACISSFIL